RCKPRAETIIDVDYPHGEARPGEEARLGIGVGSHRAVIIEMIAREIGERRGMEAHTADPILIERVRGNFHAHRLGAERPHRGKAAVNGHGIARGVLRAGERAREAEPDGAHVGRGTAAMAQRLREEPGARRLAVRAGDAGDRQGLRGAAEEAVGYGSDLTGEMRYGGNEHFMRFADPVAGRPSKCRLHELQGTRGWLIKHRTRATRQRFPHELRPMAAVATAREKERAMARRTRVERHVTDLELRGRSGETGRQLGQARAACWLLDRGRDHCSDAVRTSTGCSTGSSGATAMRRSARPITFANTGAETSPPM